MGETGNRRVIADHVLAGLICLAAVAYWGWDQSSNPVPSVTQPLRAPSVADAHEIATNQFNDAGFRLYSASDFAGAEAQFRSAIRTNPKGAVGFSNLGAALIAQRRFDEAIPALQAAIVLDPSLQLARNNLKWAV